MSADGGIIPPARLPLHQTGSKNRNPVITRSFQGQLGPRTRVRRLLAAANVLRSWPSVFRAAKRACRALRVTPGLQAPGAIVRPGEEVVRFPSASEHPDASTRVRPSEAAPGGLPVYGFRGQR